MILFEQPRRQPQNSDSLGINRDDLPNCFAQAGYIAPRFVERHARLNMSDSGKTRLNRGQVITSNLDNRAKPRTRASDQWLGRKHERIGRKNPSHAFSYVNATQCRTRDIFDLLVDDKRLAIALSVELRAPIGVADLIAIRFAVIHNLNVVNLASWPQSNGIGDKLVLAVNLIYHQCPEFSA